MKDRTPRCPGPRHQGRWTAGIWALLVFVGAAIPIVVQAGTAHLQIYFASDFTDQAYQKKTYSKVASAWKMPAGTPKEGAKAVVIVRIRRDGNAPDPVLHMMSGSQAWDKAAVDTIRRAAPFDPLPQGYRGSSVEVHVHFEYGK